MLNEIANSIHNTAIEHAWWGQPADLVRGAPTRKGRSFGDIVALIHSEASEALEEYRAGHSYNEVYWKFPNGETRSITEDEERNQGEPKGIPIEFADIIIRVLDACAGYGIDIDKAMEVKMAYNKTRTIRHGGKRI